MQPLILIEALIGCFRELKELLHGQLPNRMSARQLCETVLVTERPAVTAQLHKMLPVVWLRDLGTLVLIGNFADIVKVYGGKSDAAALAVLRLVQTQFQS